MSHFADGLCDLFDIQGDLQKPQMFVVDSRIHLGLNLWLQNMIDRKPQGDACQWPGIAWVPMNDGLGIEFSTVRIRSAEDDDHAVFTVLLDRFLDVLLTLQVKGACCGSDEALCLNQHRFRSRALDTGCDGRTLHSISFSNDHNLFPFQFHSRIPQLSSFVPLRLRSPPHQSPPPDGSS